MQVRECVDAPPLFMNKPECVCVVSTQGYADHTVSSILIKQADPPFIYGAKLFGLLWNILSVLSSQEFQTYFLNLWKAIFALYRKDCVCETESSSTARYTPPSRGTLLP